MIIWLASYPKSGNTWLRAFLSSYIYSPESEFNFELLKNIDQFPSLKKFTDANINPTNLKESSEGWLISQSYINLKNKITYLKTHNAMCKVENNLFTNLENTLGVIYLVRDPRDIVLSYANHDNTNHSAIYEIISKQGYIAALPDTYDDKSSFKIESRKKMIAGSVWGSWSENYNSWKNSKFPNKLIIKYEDMVLEPVKVFSSIINFLNKVYGLTINEEKIKKSILATNFSNLKKMEKKYGFKESLYKSDSSKNTFFNKGEVGLGKKLLDKNILHKVEKLFKIEMKELNYL